MQKGVLQQFCEIYMHSIFAAALCLPDEICPQLEGLEKLLGRLGGVVFAEIDEIGGLSNVVRH